MENIEMKIDLTPLYANTVGFDRFGSLLDAALSADRQTGGYPPYDIELVGENKYAITLAVAGFQDNEIDVQIEKGVLTVRGRKEDPKKDSRYLHRGIATRSFERNFNLADHVEVVNAQLDNGLLKIALIKEIPEAMKPRKIPVGTVTPAIENESAS
jgi:molecular chaperone IbpA